MTGAIWGTRISLFNTETQRYDFDRSLPTKGSRTRSVFPYA